MDIKLLLLLHLTVNAVLTLLLLVHKKEGSDPSVNHHFWGMALSTLSSLFLLARLFFPVKLSAIAGNLTLTASLYEESMAILILAGGTHRRAATWLKWATGAGMVAFVAITLLTDDLVTRIVFATVAPFAITGYPVEQLYKTKKQSRLTLAIVIFYNLFVVASVIRIVSCFTAERPDTLFAPTVGQDIYFFAYFIYSIFFGVGLILLAKENSDERLLTLASHDSLTGILNRPGMFASIVQSIEKCTKTGASFALMHIDIDNFKVINDTRGHMVGDGMLKKIADEVKAKTRQGDSFGRIGGDEFMLFVPSISREKLEGFADRVIAAVKSAEFEGARCTVSVGVAFVPYPGSMPINLDDLYAASDNALYSAKKAGKNTYIIVQIAE